MYSEPISKSFLNSLKQVMESNVPVAKVDPLDEKLEINSLHIPGYGIMKLETAKREAQVSSGMAHEFAQDGKHEHAHYHSQRAAMFLRAIKNHENNNNHESNLKEEVPVINETIKNSLEHHKQMYNHHKRIAEKARSEGRDKIAKEHKSLADFHSHEYEKALYHKNFKNHFTEDFDPDKYQPKPQITAPSKGKPLRVPGQVEKSNLPKMTPDNQLYDAGKQTSMGSEAFQPESLDQSFENFLQEGKSIGEDMVIEAKRRLGIIRGTTVTGQRANPIDVQPELKLNKGKALKAIKSKGF